MYIVVNFSNKIDGFKLFDNCFYPLYKNQELAYIDCSKQVELKQLDFNKISVNIQSALSNASTSVYNLIMLYDYKLQEKDPLIYSTSAFINNFKTLVCEKIFYSYRLESLYFVLLDEAERDEDGLVINTELKKNIEFDKKGYVDEPNADYFLSLADIDHISEGIELTKEDIIRNADKSSKKTFNDFNTKYLKPVEKRIENALKLIDDPNADWYRIRIENVFEKYRTDVEKKIAAVKNEEIGSGRFSFTLPKYLIKYLSSCDGDMQNKIFRLNMLDDKGKISRNEAKYRSYYKIIALILFIAKEDKKYLFGNVLSKENHYIVDVNIEDEVIEKILTDFRNNLKFERDKLGKYKFSEIEVEEYSNRPIDTIGKMEKEYIMPKLNFSIIFNVLDLSKTKEFAEYWKKRFCDRVDYVNKRLVNLTGKFRKNMIKEFNGTKTKVSANELQILINEKENNIKELKEKIASNTPNDSIQIDYQIFEENDKNVSKANKKLSERITINHLLFNIATILMVSSIVWILFRRVSELADFIVMKILFFILPSFVYLLVQIVFCFIKVSEAHIYMNQIQKYMMDKKEEITIDDKKFTDYINNIYELMLLTKYVDRLKKNADVASVDLQNFRYHKEELDTALDESDKISKLLRIRIDNKENNIVKNIPLDIDLNKYENDMYCPLLYSDENIDNYILINGEHNENINSELLNFVDNIKFDYDEVYDEQRI